MHCACAFTIGIHVVRLPLDPAKALGFLYVEAGGFY